jgi:hypothetical protein
MVQGVVMPPLLEGRKCKYTAHIGQDGIRLRVPKKGTMATIMEKDKDPHIERNGHYSQGEGGPVGDAQSDGHEYQ